MSYLFWLSEAQMSKIEPFFPLAHGVPRVDDRKVISGIIFVLKNGLPWRDAPLSMGLIRPFTTASVAGPRWAFSTRFSAI